MSDGSVAVLERDQERSQRLSELLEFAHYEPVLISDLNGAQTHATRDCLAAIVGLGDDARPPMLEYLRRVNAEIPVVAFGGRARRLEPTGTHDSEYCAFVPEPIRYRQLIDALDCAKGMRSTGARPKLFPVGVSAAVQELDRLIGQVSGFDTTVLIQGESGCGKELVARRIHALSNRRSGPFVPLNCSAIPKELLESELFGHEKGAFTGAIANRIGRFELAAGGTLFLDEIGDMSPDMQVKLLRVLQERVFERVGSTKQCAADVRVIAATHRELATLVKENQFREDLYFRIHVFPVRVPPLRERADDLQALVADLIHEGCELGRPRIEFSDSAMAVLTGYGWPGNVRELANLIERLAILYPGQSIEANALPAPYGECSPASRDLPERIFGTGLDLKAHLSSIEKELIRRALAEADGTVAHAAKLLNLQRTTLVEKLRKHQL